MGLQKILWTIRPNSHIFMTPVSGDNKIVLYLLSFHFTLTEMSVLQVQYWWFQNTSDPKWDKWDIFRAIAALQPRSWTLYTLLNDLFKYQWIFSGLHYITLCWPDAPDGGWSLSVLYKWSSETESYIYWHEQSYIFYIENTSVKVAVTVVSPTSNDPVKCSDSISDTYTNTLP